MDRKRLQRYRSTIHPLLSVFIPFLFFLTAVKLLQAILGTPPSLALPKGFFFILLVVGIGEALVANFLSKERVGNTYSRLREVMLYLIGSYLAVLALTGDLFRGDFSPLKASMPLSMALVLGQWFIAFWIHRGFKEREVYLGLLLDKQGNKLKTSVRELFAEATLSQKAIIRARRFLVLFQVVAFCLLLLSFATAASPGGLLVVLAFAHFAGGIAFLALLNDLLEEEALLTEGLIVDPGLRRRRYAVFATLLAVAGLLAAAFLGRRSLLPVSYLASFLDLLHSWLSRDSKFVLMDRRPQKEIPDNPAGNLALPQSAVSAGAEGPSPVAAVIRIVGLCLLIGLGLLVVFFLVRPFLSRNARERIKELHPLQFLANKLRSVFRIFSQGMGGLLAWLKAPRKGFRKAARTLVKLLEESALFGREGERTASRGPDRVKQRAVSRIIRGYLRLIHWGERCGVRFSPTVGPMDYVRMLSRTMPEAGKLLIDAGSLFEEIVFSRHSIESSTVSRYFDTIKAIVRTRRGAATIAEV